MIQISSLLQSTYKYLKFKQLSRKNNIKTKRMNLHARLDFFPDGSDVVPVVVAPLSVEPSGCRRKEDGGDAKADNVCWVSGVTKLLDDGG